MPTQGIGILGGSFNPVHVGHLRLAIEVFEALSPLLDHIDLVPCAEPPHKKSAGLLPFSLRTALLEAAVADIPYLRVNTIESSRTGPSYTYDTLQAYRAQLPHLRPMFLLGGEDFATIDQWYMGAALPQVADIAVVPRAGAHSSTFCRTVHKLWPDAEFIPPPNGNEGGYCALSPWGTRLLYLPLPRLDVSASLIRERWIAGRDIQYFLPRSVIKLLQSHREQSLLHWDACSSTSTNP